MGILSGPKIRKQVDAGVICIDPYNPKHVNPNSYDVTLGGKLMEYRKPILDIRDKSTLETIEKFIPEEGYLLLPGRGVLGTTIERVHTDRYVPILNGKSTCGRLFLTIHQTAGFGDHGFDGRWTLEIMAMDRPVKLYCGMRIGQIVFETLVGEPEPYDGKYQGQKEVTAAKVEEAKLLRDEVMAQDKVECNHSGDIDQVQISQLLGSNAKCLVCGFIYPKGGNPERLTPCPEDVTATGQ